MRYDKWTKKQRVDKTTKNAPVGASALGGLKLFS